MTRFAPTLFVGLGGSGIQILRSVKTYVQRDSDEALTDVPVAFLAFDYDPRSNEEAAESLKPLLPGEFRFFDPRSIATCVRNVTRTRKGSNPDAKPQWEFPEILEWYPDPEAKYVSYPQGEENGARQWRPLGRLGFFLNDREMVGAISGALSELDRRRHATERLGTTANVCLVSSLAGGTGSAMIFDVAVNLRKIRRDIAIRAYFILPELFEGADQKDRLLPNSFATIWEIANLKNHHVRFHAQYPRSLAITEDDSPPPFQRVFLLGPFIGERRPFSQPGDVYPVLGEILYLTMTPELRAAAISSESNASADSAAPLTDPRSRHVFCSTSAMGINLINYAELGELCAARLVSELATEERPFSRFLAGPKPENPVRDELDAISKKIAAVDRLSPDYFKKHLTSIVRSRQWTSETLKTAIEDFEALCGWRRAEAGVDRNSTLPKNFPGFLKPIVEEAEREVRDRLTLLRGKYVVPREFEAFLRDLRNALRLHQGDLPILRIPPSVKGYSRWLEEGFGLWFLARPLTAWRLNRLISDLVGSIETSIGDEGKAIWLRVAVEHGVINVIEHLLEEEKQRWASLTDFQIAAGALLAPYLIKERQREQIYLDGRRADALAVVPAELLAKVSRVEDREHFKRDVLENFVQAHKAFAAAEQRARPETIRQWLKRNSTHFRTFLGKRGRELDPPENPDEVLLSPTSLFKVEEIRGALLRTRTRVFEDGRTAAPARLRVARAVVPRRFENYTDFEELLRRLVRGYLNANANIEGTTTIHDKRIVVLVDELFHPAEDIAGIYDYYNEYKRAEVDPLLFHIHKDWPAKFAVIISDAARRSVVLCGNDRCVADIRAHSRTRIFCPSCEKPIRSRCGNANCDEDTLQSTPALGSIIRGKHCPSCREFLRTYWWTCHFHGDVPIDKPACPECVRTGSRLPSRRPDIEDRFECPRCDPSLGKPFSATDNLARFLRDGVNGHDLQAAERLFDRYLFRDRTCPMCGTLLVPVCMESETERRHYLHRDRHRGPYEPFRCYLHNVTYLTCGVCQFPVRNDADTCKRCGSQLGACRFCTPARHLLILKTTDDARCTHCGLYPAEPPVADASTRPAPAPNDVFCSNIFGCRAAGRQSTFEAGTDPCPVCVNKELRPLEVQTLREHLGACPFCAALLGGSDAARGGALRHGQQCCLCGQSWQTVDALISDPDAWNVAVIIGRALVASLDHDETFARLYATMPTSVSFVKSLEEFSARVGRVEVRNQVCPRIISLIQHWQSQFGCSGDATGKSTQSSTKDTQPSARGDLRSRTLDPDEILRFHGDIPQLIRWLMDRGFEKDDLERLHISVQTQVSDQMSGQRIRQMFKDAAAQWDGVAD